MTTQRAGTTAVGERTELAMQVTTAIRQLRDMGYDVRVVSATDHGTTIDVCRRDGMYLYTSTISRRPVG